MNEPTQDIPAPVEPQPRKISILEQKIAEALTRHHAEIETLIRMGSVFERVPEHIAEKCRFYDGGLDFNNLTRDESIEAMKALAAGTWIKSVNSLYSDCIDYEAKIDGVRVRLWAAAAPGSCRVIETEVAVPASTYIRRTLVCSEKEEA